MGILILAATCLMMHMSNRSQHDQVEYELPSSKSSNIEGSLIFYTLCKRMGYSIERNEIAIVDSLSEQVGVFLLLEPWVSLHRLEQDQLKSWVATGGVLITDEADSIMDQIPYAKSHHERGENENSPPQKRLKAIISILPEEADAGLISQDIDKIAFEGRRSYSEEEFIKLKEMSKPNVLLRDYSGIRIIDYPYGKGSIICLSDSSFLKNKCIVHHDNSILSVNLIAYSLSKARNGSIFYDEYHYGSGQTQTGIGILTGSLLKTPAGWSILCIFTAGSLLLILHGRQFGSRLPVYQKKTRRSKMEFIEALAATYKTAGAHRLCLQMIDSWFRERLTHSLGLPPKASNETIALLASKDDPEIKKHIRQTLDESTQLLSKDKISENSLLKIIYQFKKIEGKVYRGHSNRISNRQSGYHRA